MIAPTIAPTAVSIRPTTLLEVGIQELEHGPYEQAFCRLRHTDPPRYCAEGVFVDQLVRAYPERFRWLKDGFYHDGTDSRSDLSRAEWRLLHPRGERIATRAAAIMGAPSIMAANDRCLRTFPEIAAAFRAALAEDAAGILPYYDGSPR